MTYFLRKSKAESSFYGVAPNESSIQDILVRRRKNGEGMFKKKLSKVICVPKKVRAQVNTKKMLKLWPKNKHL